MRHRDTETQRELLFSVSLCLRGLCLLCVPTLQQEPREPRGFAGLRGGAVVIAALYRIGHVHHMAANAIAEVASGGRPCVAAFTVKGEGRARDVEAIPDIAMATGAAVRHAGA